MVQRNNEIGDMRNPFLYKCEANEESWWDPQQRHHIGLEVALGVVVFLSTLVLTDAAVAGLVFGGHVFGGLFLGDTSLEGELLEGKLNGLMGDSIPGALALSTLYTRTRLSDSRCSSSNQSSSQVVESGVSGTSFIYRLLLTF